MRYSKPQWFWNFNKGWEGEYIVLQSNYLVDELDYCETNGLLY